MSALAKERGIFLSMDQLAASVIPNGPGAITCYVWLQEYFDSCGDYEPNRKEIHLDPITKTELHKEYAFDMTRRGTATIHRPIIAYSTFVKIWNDCFPHVKIRAYKACSGKCEFCSMFTALMRKNNTLEALKLIREFRAHHRSDFMLDRITYQRRMNLGIDEPTKYLSIITDGMQQFHTELPYSANRKQHPIKVKQHLQGLTAHGRRTRLYRTVDHIKLGANMNIYVLLLAIEEEYLASGGKLPGTLFIQVDGGSENANYWVLAWMEIIIALDIGITEIWLCRMRVGHTHADQDARFGLIWVQARNEHLLTPQRYNEIVGDALKDSPGGIELVDLFVVPDLVKAVDDLMDKDLSKAFKVENTQLVFRFQKVEKSELYPLGSKCTYRASASDRIIEFIKVDKTKSPIGLAPRMVFVDWHPEAGISILKSIPDLSNIGPHPFVEGSVEELHNNIASIKKNMLISLSPKALHDWDLFSQMLPQPQETPECFIKRAEMRVPFKEALSSLKGMPKQIEPVPLKDIGAEEVRDYFAPSVTTGASVRWRGCLKPEPPRVTLDDRSDATIRTAKRKAKKSVVGALHEGMNIHRLWILFLKVCTKLRFGGVCSSIHMARLSQA